MKINKRFLKMLTFSFIHRMFASINNFIHKYLYITIMKKNQNNAVKNTGAIIVRDKHLTYHKRLEAIVNHYKTANPDNVTPDDLDKMNKSNMIRKMIDDRFSQLFTVAKKVNRDA